MGFVLSDWILYYREEFEILVQSGKDIEPLEDRYNRLMNLLDSDKKQVAKYKDKLFGPARDLVVAGTTVFWEYETASHLNMLVVWKTLSLQERGKLIAYMQTSNMLKTLQRHIELQKEEQDRRENESKSKRK